MNLVLKEMPGLRETPQIRMLFSKIPGERPVEVPPAHSYDELRAVLKDKAHASAQKVEHALVDLQATGSTFLENLPLDDAELKALVRERELRQ